MASNRLTTLKNQLEELKHNRTQLDQQYEEALGQFKAMHGQEIEEALESRGMTASEEQIEQFHELNKQKAAPLSIDIMDPHEQTTREAQDAGTLPPPPLPPREQVAARYQQVRETEWEAALLDLMAGVYKNNSDPKPDDAIRTALELLPLIKELANGQVHALENLHHELDDKVTEIENQRNGLESEIYKLTSSLTSSMTPSVLSRPRQSKHDASEKAAEESPTRSPK